MQLIRQSVLARMKGVSRPAIGAAVKKGLLTLVDGKIDLDAQATQDYLSQESRQFSLGGRTIPAVAKIENPKREAKAVAGADREPPKPKVVRPARRVADTDLGELGVLRGDLDKQKIQEQIIQLQIKNDQQRHRLVSRELVERLVGRISAIDNAQFLQYGDKLAPEICGICGITDPATEARVRERLQAEAYDTLAHIQRLIDEFLASVQKEELAESDEVVA